MSDYVSNSNDNGNSRTSANPGEPPGAQEGDLMLAMASVDDNGGPFTFTFPSDFIVIDDIYETTGSNMQCWLGYKIRGPNQGQGYLWSHNGPNLPTQATVTCYRNVDQANPFDVVYSRGNHYNAFNNAPNTAARSITTLSPAARVAIFQFLTNTISGPAGPPAGYTTRANYCGNGGFSNRGAYSCDRVVAAPGLEVPGPFTHTDTTNNAATRNFTLALRTADSGSKFANARLADIDGVDRNNQENLTWAWYDEYPGIGVFPTEFGNDGTTDALGNFKVEIEKSTLEVGQLGYLAVANFGQLWSGVYPTVVDSA